MNTRLSTLLVTGLVSLCVPPSARAVTVQNPNDVLADGSAFFMVEAEDASEFGGDDPSIGFVVVSKDDPITSIETAEKGGLDILPADTNASGGAALLDEIGGGRQANTAVWEVQFTTPATYYLYLHASMYNSDANTSYGNEDSIFLPPAFNLNSSSDWVGFEGLDQFGDPMTGDHIYDGWMPIFNNKVVMSAGQTSVHNDTNEDFWDGTFHWMFADFAVDSDENGSYIDDYGLAIQYEVTEADVDKVLTFEISNREQYGVIDALLFSTSNELLIEYSQEQMDDFFVNLGGGPLTGDFDDDGQLTIADIDELTQQSASQQNLPAYDLNADALVDESDVTFWVKDLFHTWIGDANLDNEFNSGDLVQGLSSGTYEVDTDAVWSTGDFNGDGRANTTDLVVALADGGYEQGPRAATAAVPEPAGLLLALIGFGALCPRRRARR